MRYRVLRRNSRNGLLINQDGSWPKSHKEEMGLIRAVNVVQAGDTGYKSAAKQFGVPYSTVERYVKNSESRPDNLVNVPLGKWSVLSRGLKNELVEYCVEMYKRFYWLRKHDIKRMVFQQEIANYIKHPFSKKKINHLGRNGLLLF
ncbi:hypothetical protein PR048_030886 [Dryococelus australis]|uniref:HTH psq-type domain-containing protein n=1 Tax=Dryococelus australis TaxID=614101 RepID=A0ABQ9GAW8_9NEOP|nr:hypothetical protein PR048_030886 [Dryococelus australis]